MHGSLERSGALVINIQDDILRLHAMGLLDRKLRAVSESEQDIEEWKRWALRAVQAAYGYELRIIYLIAANYILGFDEKLKAETHHFVQADAAEASKNGTLKELVDRCFGSA